MLMENIERWGGHVCIGETECMGTSDSTKGEGDGGLGGGSRSRARRR